MTPESPNTHERPHALPVHVHRDGREPARSLARPEDEKGALDTPTEYDPVGEERRAVEDETPERVRDREDVQRVWAVCVQQVRHARAASDDSAEVEHPGTQEPWKPARDHGEGSVES